MASFSSSTPSPSSSLSSQHAYIPLPAQWKVLIREHQESQVELPPCPVKAIKRIEAIGNHLLSPLFLLLLKFLSGDIAYRCHWRYHSANYQREALTQKTWRRSPPSPPPPPPLSAATSFSSTVIMSCDIFYLGFWKILVRAALGLEQFPVRFCVQSTHNLFSLWVTHKPFYSSSSDCS